MVVQRCGQCAYMGRLIKKGHVGLQVRNTIAKWWWQEGQHSICTCTS